MRFLGTSFVLLISLAVASAVDPPQSEKGVGEPEKAGAGMAGVAKLMVAPEEAECNMLEQYECSAPDSGCRCHNIHTLCDGVNDCADGSDEEEEFCLGTCANSYGYWCSKHARCITRVNMCDGSRACARKSDRKRVCRQLGCPTELGMTLCYRSKQCVHTADLCDGDGATPCINGWQPESSSQICTDYFEMMMSTPVMNVETTPMATTRMPEEPESTTVPEPTTTTTMPQDDVYINGVFVDCRNHADLTATYSGDAWPVRSVGDINAGVSICEASLYTHNILRQNHQDTNHLVYDSALAASAERWSIQLANENDFYHSDRDTDRNGAGENLAYQSSSGIEVLFGVTDSALAWYIELEEGNYNFNTGSGTGTVGHFTQMVWSDSVRIGCGLARVYDGEYLKTYTTCHYDPPGNYNNQYTEKVRPLVSSPFIPTSFVQLELENDGCITRADSCNQWQSYCAQYDVVAEGCPSTCFCEA